DLFFKCIQRCPVNTDQVLDLLVIVIVGKRIKALETVPFHGGFLETGEGFLATAPGHPEQNQCNQHRCAESDQKRAEPSILLKPLLHGNDNGLRKSRCSSYSTAHSVLFGMFDLTTRAWSL